MSDRSITGWYKSGMPWVWLNAGAVSISIIMVFGLLGLIAMRGLGHFWPTSIAELQYKEFDGSVIRLVGEFHDSEMVPVQRLIDAGITPPEGVEDVTRHLFKLGNREINGQDFRWLIGENIQSKNLPEELLTIERHEWGNFYGYLHEVKENGVLVASGQGAYEALLDRLDYVVELHDQIRDLEKGEIGTINYALERLRLDERGLELDGELDAISQQEIASQRSQLNQQYQGLKSELNALYKASKRDTFVMETMAGKKVELEMAHIVNIYQPNAMSGFGKMGFYIAKIWEFMTDEPREANTEGGIFPAIFGTVMMVILMSILVTPFGVIAAVYLREYAKQGLLTRTIRIAVNNLAGVPSIVYGVFGLGFFVYFLGGSIDQLFFPEALPAPTFGTPGLLWASLTLAILTVPVVIVATEEGLSRIPRSIREGSLALGATKAETLWRTVLPMASPAMMTGLILAVARAAGEVAPLMLVGVVKLAPTLPLDGNFPFLHLDRKFMHLGFHIYDVGFQSPNVEAARPLVYATALLLVVIIVALNLTAIAIRNHLREKYRALEH